MPSWTNYPACTASSKGTIGEIHLVGNMILPTSASPYRYLGLLLSSRYNTRAAGRVLWQWLKQPEFTVPPFVEEPPASRFR